MRQQGIRVVDLSNDLSKSERLFTGAVELIQNTAVRWSVPIRERRFSQPYGRWRQDAVAIKGVLADLGLVPERLWWGPMTLTPKKALAVLDRIERMRPRQVLEAGAGTSTAILAAAAQRYDFELLSLENHDNTIEYVDWLIGDLPCCNRLTLQKCGFRRFRSRTGRSYRWYNADFSMLGAPIDLMFIDGPMGKLVGRNGAVHEVLSHLNQTNEIILDDSKRKHERECVTEWIDDYPGTHFEVFQDVGMFSGSVKI